MGRLAHTILFAVLAIAASTAIAPGAARAQSDLYVGYTLIDPEKETRTAACYMLVEGGKIAALGQGTVPAHIRQNATRTHDFTGLYALPGLINTHAHLTLGPLGGGSDGKGQPYAEIRYDPAITVHNARMLLAFGVTTVRNPGGDTAVNLAYARAARAGQIMGPEALTAGLVIDRTPLPFRGLTDRPTPERGVAAIVREQAAAGVDYVKFYFSLTDSDLAEGIRTARAAGVRSIAHLDQVSWTRAAELGIDALVHAMPTSPDLLPVEKRATYRAKARPGSFGFFEWYEAADLNGPEIAHLLKLLAQRRVHVDATLAAFKPVFWGDDVGVRDWRIDLAHPAMAASWRAFPFDLGWTASDHARAKAVWPKVLELTRRLYEAGVPMTIGDDLGNPYVPPGAGMMREMALHVEAGIPRWAVLRMATSRAADILRIGDRTGRIARGYEADVVFLTQDPSIDVMNAANVRAVLNNGRLLSASELKGDVQ